MEGAHLGATAGRKRQVEVTRRVALDGGGTASRGRGPGTRVPGIAAVRCGGVRARQPQVGAAEAAGLEALYLAVGKSHGHLVSERPQRCRVPCRCFVHVTHVQAKVGNRHGY